MRSSGLRILVIAVLISFIGIISIYSSTSYREGERWHQIYKRQAFWVLAGLVLFLLVSNLNYRRFWDWNYFLYAGALIFLLLVLALGAVRSGAQRWLSIAWFNFQPSEFAKLIILVFLARYFSGKTAADISLETNKLGMLRALIFPFFFTAIPAGLIAEQPDLGSAVLVLFLLIGMLFISGVKFRYIFILFLVVALFSPFIWHGLRDYQKERLLVFLNPNIDPLGAGYTIINSKIAIGSGGVFGKGWFAGTQSQLYFLPECHTDFVFATFAEQTGLLGSLLLLVLYYLLVREGIMIAQRTRDHFGRLLASGISLLLGVQIFINIAMNLGLAPVVGIPLPLMSYGGSCAVMTFVSLGILVNIDRTRSVF